MVIDERDTGLRASTRTVAGVEVEVIEAGSGSPLLFLHSGEGPVAVSDEYLRCLAQFSHVTAPWHPGFGHSELPDRYRTVGDLACFYLDLLDTFPGDPPLLVGASFGGWIASELAIHNTSRISGLVLIDPLGIKIGGREDRDIVDLHALSSEDRAAVLFHDSSMASRKYGAMSDHDRQGIARSLAAEARFGWQPYMHDPSLRQWLHRIDVPTLILRGHHDQVVTSAYHQAFVDEIPNATLMSIDDAGHYPHLEKPASVRRHIESFAESIRIT